MNDYYKKLTKEAKIEYWEDQGYLESITDPHIQMTTSLMLENQKLYNELVKEDNCLELVRLIVPNLLAFKIVSVQPKLSPISIIYYSKQYEIKSTENVAKSRKLKSEYVKDIINEINNEIFLDLFNNCNFSKKINCFYQEDFYEEISQLDEMISEKSNRKKWIIVSDKTLKIFPYIFDLCNDYQMHVIENCSKNGIVMGSKGNNFFDSSYCYSPYIILSKNKIIRYGKMLRKDNAFGKLTW